MGSVVDPLTQALLVEEVAPRSAIAEALLSSVAGAVPRLHALVHAGAASPEVLTQYLARSEAPFVRQVVPVADLVERLPRGLCARLLAVPIRLDAITGTVDVAVANAHDPHPASEIAHHLGAPVRVVRAPLAAIEEALRRDDLRLGGRGARARVATPPPPQPVLSSTIPGGGDFAHRAAFEYGPAGPRRVQTPPWGTPIHSVRPTLSSAPPGSGYGSEIPIPLTRKTFGPEAILSAVASGGALASDLAGAELPLAIPAPPLLPSATSFAPQGYTPRPAFALPELDRVVAALGAASARDEVLDLVLEGARMVAVKIALFVVKKGGYTGWEATPELADRAAIQSVVLPLDATSIFDRAVREDVYLGPIRYDEVHAPLLRVLRNPSREVAIVPIRVSGKTAVILLADDLDDTMTGTRRLDELARAAGEAFARILRARR